MTARVLVVDDIISNVKLLEAKLTAEYFEVLTASSGEQLRLLVRRTDGGTETADLKVGSVRRLRATTASWYGPGLFGNRPACGQTLTPGLRGVAHKQRCYEQRAHFALGRDQYGDQDRRDAIERGGYGHNRAFAGVHRARTARASFPHQLFGQQHYWASSAYSAIPRARALAMHMFRPQSSIPRAEFV